MRASTKRLRSLPLLLALVVVAVLAYGVALDRAEGELEQGGGSGAAHVPRDPSGHRLYFLILDSLAVDDVDAIPALRSLAESSFTSTVQPCIDNFTTSCVREELTGRSRTSVFSMLEDFKVLSPDVGANLVQDAKAAGMRTALVSAGNLRSWTSRVDADIRVDARGERRSELEIALEAAANHDLVIHHWIWIDIASHHRRTRPDRYDEALAETSTFLDGLRAGLPSDMDLIVAGDHGHDHDGRHIEGLDVPTFVAAHTDNLRIVHPEARLPGTGVRFLAGAATGLASASMRVEPHYREWLSDHVGEGLRTSGTNLDEATAPKLATGLVLAAILLAVVSMTALPLSVGAPVMVWAAILGLTFEQWLHLTSQRGPIGDDFASWSWLVPVILIVATARRRGDPLRGAAAGGIVLLLALWPGLARYAVLQNTGGAVVPAFVVLAILSWRQRSTRDRGALLALGIAALLVCSAFNANTFRIRHYPLGGLDRELAIAIVAALCGAVYALVDRSPLRVLGVAVAVVAASSAPHPVQAAVFVAFGIFVLVVRNRPRTAIALALAASAVALAPKKDAGMLGLVLACALGLRALGRIEAPTRSVVWATALVLVFGSYAGLAWTMGLTISGLDFDFALAWLPGRWHMTLWWAVAIAMILKILLPLVVLAILAGRLLDARVARLALGLAARLAIARAGATVLLVTLWLAPSGVGAATTRMRVMLFDGLCWLALGLAFAAMRARRARRHAAGR